MIIKCPKCGNIVSDRTSECPSCGEVLNTRPYAAEPQQIQSEPAAPETPTVQPAEPQPAPAVQPNPTVEPAPAAEPAPAVQSNPVAQPLPPAQPVPEKKKKSWKGLIWGSVAVVALAGILSLYTLAITKMGLETIRIEVHFYTKPAVTEPAPAVQDTTATAIVSEAETAQTGLK